MQRQLNEIIKYKSVIYICKKRNIYGCLSCESRDIFICKDLFNKKNCFISKNIRSKIVLKYAKRYPNIYYLIKNEII